MPPRWWLSTECTVPLVHLQAPSQQYMAFVHVLALAPAMCTSTDLDKQVRSADTSLGWAIRRLAGGSHLIWLRWGVLNCCQCVVLCLLPQGIQQLLSRLASTTQQQLWRG